MAAYVDRVERKAAREVKGERAGHACLGLDDFLLPDSLAVSTDLIDYGAMMRIQFLLRGAEP
jgi:hypothetical protein